MTSEYNAISNKKGNIIPQNYFLNSN